MPEEATTAAPAATAPAVTGAVAPTLPASFETLGDDDSIIESLKTEHAAGKFDEALGKAPAKPKGKPAATVAEPAEAEATQPEGPQYADVTAALAAITAAFESGDPVELAKATGKPKEFFEANDAKWKAFRAEKRALSAQAVTLKRAESQFRKAVDDARAELGPAVAASRAYKSGDLAQFVKIVEALTGDTYDVAQRKVIEGEVAADPSTKALRKQLAEQAAKIAELENRTKTEEQTREQRQAAASQRVDAALTTELARHPVAKIRGFKALVLDAIRSSGKGADGHFTMGYREAADAVVAERKAEAQALGLRSEPAPAPAPVGRQPAIPPRARAADARAPDGEAWRSGEMDDDAIIESIKADVRSGRLKV